MKSTPVLLAAALSVAAFTSAVPAQTQPARDPAAGAATRQPPPRDPVPGVGPGGATMRLGGPGGVVDTIERVLTEEQRATLRQETEANRDKSRELEEKLRIVQRELREASIAEKPDPQVLEEKSKQLGELEGQRALLRAKMLAKIAPSLTPAQRERIKALRDLIGRPDGNRPFTGGRAGPGTDGADPLRRAPGELPAPAKGDLERPAPKP